MMTPVRAGAAPRARGRALCLLSLVALLSGCFSPPGKPLSYPRGEGAWDEQRIHPDAKPEDARQASASLTEMLGKDQPPTETEEAGAEVSPAGGQFSFTLEQAINHALDHNRSVLSRYDDIRRSHYNIVIAKSQFEIKIRPEAKLGADQEGSSWSYGGAASKKLDFGTNIETAVVQSRTGDTHNTDTSVSITQPLLRGAGILVNTNPIISAEREVEGRKRSYELAKENLVVDVASSFYDIMRQRAIVLLNERSADRMKMLLETSRAKQRVGLASQLDILRAEIQLSEAMDNLESARQALHNAEDNLKVALGLPPSASINVVGKIGYSIVRIDEQRAIDTALASRLDLRELLAKIGDARRQYRVARNAVLPDLDLNLRYLWLGTGETAGESTRLGDFGWSVGVSTSTEIRRTAERARLEQNRIDIETSRLSYADRLDETIQEVRREVRNLNMSLARIDIQERNLVQSRRQLQLARLQFVKGLADNFDVIDAEQRLISAESRYVFVVTDYILAQFRLRRAMGTLTEKPKNI